MKASEVLAKYAAGERNFQRVNLRGQSFKGKNLSGADFSEADLRSTNFTNADLTGANFTGVKCGLQKRWVALLTILAWLLAAMSGFCSIFSGYLVSLIFESNMDSQIIGWVALLVIVIFLIAMIRQGIRAVAVTVLLAGVVVLSGAVVPVFIGVVAGAGAIAGAEAVAGAVIQTGAVLGTVAAILARVVLGTGAERVVGAEIVAIPVAVAVAGAGGYIGWRAMQKDPRDDWAREFAIAFSAFGGTSFRGADLTDTNFAGTRLKSTDMRDANLTRVRWHGAKILDRVRPGNSYLNKVQLRQWLIGEGADKNFDGQYLRGVNLQGADLTDASFINANLSEANLQDADLSRARLVQTQLDKTDFTGATLTGAFIEDWGITSSTLFDRVKCEYVFMRLPTDDNPEPCRKPDNPLEVFEDGDFGDFIQPIFDTLDLYHNQGVDPRAIAISWKKLAEDNPDAQLQFASMEVKGEDNLLLRLKTAPNADLSQLSGDYFETYNQIKALAEAESQKLIAEKNQQIRRLESFVETALKRPGFYAENYNHQGDNEMTGDKYEQTGNFGIGQMSGGEIQSGAKVAGVINEAQKQNLADAAQEIQTLLEQLSKTYPTATSREKNIVVGEAVDRIENDPTFKAKVINALKAGGTEAFKEAINHPLVNILVATIEGWQDAE